MIDNEDMLQKGGDGEKVLDLGDLIEDNLTKEQRAKNERAMLLAQQVAGEGVGAMARVMYQHAA